MISAPKKEKSAPAQFNFSPLFAHNRPHVAPVEVAKSLGITDQQVRNLLDAGRFVAVPIGAGPSSGPRHVRILRYTVEAWWLESFFAAHGAEYPLPNSAEITWWRAELRKKGPL